MPQVDAAVEADELRRLAQEVLDGPGAAAPPQPVPACAPTMGKLKTVRYTHDAMIDLIIASPGISQNALAAAFSYTPGWISNMMASDAFQARLAERRKEVIDPVLVASVEERMRGMLVQAHDVITRKLDEPNVKPEVALRALELGAKALGLGGHAPPPVVPIDLDKLAERLIALNPTRSHIPGVVLEKEINP